MWYVYSGLNYCKLGFWPFGEDAYVFNVSVSNYGGNVIGEFEFGFEFGCEIQ